MDANRADDSIRLDPKHPLIRKIADMTAAATGMELSIVYPEQSGWGQSLCNTGDRLPAFCRQIKSTADGSKQCSMCHVLMAVAACNGGPVEQRCHAGAFVMVLPAEGRNGQTVAVLSSCMYASGGAWEEVRRRGVKLGLDLKQLRKSYQQLRRLNEDQLRMLKAGMQAMGDALKVLRENQDMRRRADEMNARTDPVKAIEALLEKPDWASRAQSPGGRPLLVHVVCELARQRPDLPLSVKELAVAAHLTPNHFTTMFHEHVGVSFNEYLTDLRIERSRKLLRNPLLNINEIARMAGYEDPGYFTRRFRQKTGLTPREWRNRNAALPAK